MKKAKKVLALVLVLALTVAMSVAGTIAWLQDDDHELNVMTVGNVTIEQIEEQRDENGDFEPFEDDKKMIPTTEDPAWTGTVEMGDYEYSVQDVENVVDKFVTVKNTGTEPAYIRTILAFEDTEDYALTSAIHTVEGRKGLSWVGDGNGKYLVIEDADGTKYTVAWYVYDGADYANLAEGDTVGIIDPNEVTEPSLLQLYLDKSVDNEFYNILTENGKDAKYDIHALSQGVQAAGFADAETALNTAFGELTMANGEVIADWFGTLLGEEWKVVE